MAGRAKYITKQRNKYRTVHSKAQGRRKPADWIWRKSGALWVRKGHDGKPFVLGDGDEIWAVTRHWVDSKGRIPKSARR